MNLVMDEEETTKKVLFTIGARSKGKTERKEVENLTYPLLQSKEVFEVVEGHLLRMENIRWLEWHLRPWNGIILPRR